MVAGGTGITPCYQVVDEILRDPNDPTQISLIFACNDVNDLLCRETLDRWAKEVRRIRGGARGPERRSAA